MRIDRNSIPPGMNTRPATFRTSESGSSPSSDPRDSVALSGADPAAEVKKPVAPSLARRAGAVALAVSAGVAAFAGLIHVINSGGGPPPPQQPPTSIGVVVETPQPPSNLPFTPTQPTAPVAEPTQPAQPTAPVAEPTQPAQPTAPVAEPTQPIQPTAPVAEPTQPAQPTAPVAEPTQPIQPTAPIQQPDKPKDAEIDSSLPANVRALTPEFFEDLGHISYNYKGIAKGEFVLTFDDGPNPNVTPKILDTLNEHGVQGAVFFVTGQNAQRYPDLLRRIVDEGHVLGGHTWSHPSLTGLSRQQALSELTRTDEAVDKVLGYDYPLNLVRPPYGATNASVLETIGEAYGGNSVLWQVDSEDWKVQSDLRQGNPTTSLVDRVVAGANQVDRRGTGGVILMHDIHSNTAKDLGKVLDALKARGYRIISITDIGRTDSAPGGLANQ